MDVKIEYSDFLLSCSHPLGKGSEESANGLFDYTAKLCSEIFSEQTLEVFKEYKIDVFEVIFSGKNTISELTKKAYGSKHHALLPMLERCVFLSEAVKGNLLFYCAIEKKNGIASLGEPEQIRFILEGEAPLKFRKKLEKNNGRIIPEKKMTLFRILAAKKLVNIRLKLLVDAMKSAQSDRRFIARFNEEIFFKNILMGTRRLAASDVFLFFSGEGANQYINIKSKPVQIAAIALYSIATKNLELSDIYSVEKIFPTQEGAWHIRGKDNLKIEAANEFVSILRSADFDAIISMLSQMGLALLKIKLPQIDLSRVKALADNYTLYAGISNISAAFIAITKNESITLHMLSKRLGADFDRVMRAAEELSGYDKVVSLCNCVALLEKDKNFEISELEGYGEAVALQNRIGYANDMSEVKF